MKFFAVLLITSFTFFQGVQAAQDPNDILVKFKTERALIQYSALSLRGGLVVENLGYANWARIRFPSDAHNLIKLESLKNNPDVLKLQPNFELRLIEDYSQNGTYLSANLLNELFELSQQQATPQTPTPIEKPDLPILLSSTGGSGEDPLFKNQWGMRDIGAKKAWSQSRGKGVIVAVIDSGVDYTHEDLLDNMWRNQGEIGFDDQGRNKSNNGVDDDGNGYIDDAMAWDFSDNDNKPYDVHGQLLDVILKGQNPGHGTHCAGNIAARGDNGKGTSGVAPLAQIMPLRFISKSGKGTTSDAIRAIMYAINNGAKVLSNSWGTEGEDPKEAGDNEALKEVITGGQEKGVLFVFAAGNGHAGVGYDNDSDAKPAVPASYSIENIISVAAIDKDNKLGKFSNWGLRSVHLAAPGVEVFSTTVGNTYADKIIDLFGFKVGWDGTSMAAPHVAGALALYWSKHPEANWRAVKKALLDATVPIASMKGKSITGGKLSLEKL